MSLSERIMAGQHVETRRNPSAEASRPRGDNRAVSVTTIDRRGSRTRREFSAHRDRRGDIVVALPADVAWVQLDHAGVDAAFENGDTSRFSTIDPSGPATLVSVAGAWDPRRDVFVPDEASTLVYDSDRQRWTIRFPSNVGPSARGR